MRLATLLTVLSVCYLCTHTHTHTHTHSCCVVFSNLYFIPSQGCTCMAYFPSSWESHTSGVCQEWAWQSTLIKDLVVMDPDQHCSVPTGKESSPVWVILLSTLEVLSLDSGSLGQGKMCNDPLPIKGTMWHRVVPQESNLLRFSITWQGNTEGVLCGVG